MIAALQLGWWDLFRVAVCGEGAMIFGQTLYVFSLSSQGLLRAPPRHVVSVAFAHNLAVVFMVVQVALRIGHSWSWWPSPFAAVVFSLTHYALWTLGRELRGRIAAG